MAIYSREQLTKKSFPIVDKYIKEVQLYWGSNGPRPKTDVAGYLPIGVEWFRSTKLNNLIGWDTFPCTDVIMGCTHYIESLILKFSWQGFQILKPEYSYYSLMGKHGVEPDALKENLPLIVSLPNYHYADIRPDWEDILRECEKKNIDIHIDMAWLVTAKNIELDLSHPCIKSFAMSMSKYNLQWNRVGIRWCRQRTMDSVTMLNHYYGEVNTTITSCGAFMAERIPRDYYWNTFATHHADICNQLDLIPTKIIHVAHEDYMQPIGIGRAISENSQC